MTSEPLISVFMPVRSYSPYCVAAVRSILNQSHHNLELVVVGHDDVDELLDQLPGDDRISGVRRNGPGVIGASKTGLAHCQGDYIARMDSDDIAHPDRLRDQLQFQLSNPQIGLVGSCVELFSENGVIGPGNQKYVQWLNSVQTPTDIANACLIESPMPNPSLFATRAFWQTIGPYREMGWPEDYDLILRAWLSDIKMAKPPNVLLRWREHPERLTHTDDRYSREAFIKAKAWAVAQPASGLGLDNGRATWICGTGRNARYWHDALVTNGVNVLGFVELDHAKVKTQKRHLPVVTYKQLASIIDDALVISAISGWSARDALITWFGEHKMRIGVDYILGG